MRNKLFLLFVLAMPLMITACESGPKAEARRYADRMPDRIGSFSLEEDETIELTAEAVGSSGHVTLVYEADDVGTIYVSFDAYGTESAAEVASASRQRDWRLMGVAFETNRAPRYRVLSRADVADLPGGRLAIFDSETIIIEVQFIKDNAEATIADDDWTAALTAVRDVAESLR